MRLKDKVSVITGGSRGIGEAIAHLFGKEGSKVVIADIDEKTGKEAEKKLKEAQIEAKFVRTDVSDEESVKNLMNETVKSFGKVSVLVNNAAVSIRKSAVDTSLEEWEKVIGVNLTGAFLCSKYAVEAMEEADEGGAIINVASWHADRTITRFAAYAASKGGMTALTRQMALDCGASNIRVNAVLPSTVDTPMLYETMQNLPDPDEAWKQTLDFQPLGRIATADDIAYACLYLANDESSYVSGHSLRVDGGTYVKVARPLMFD